MKRFTMTELVATCLLWLMIGFVLGWNGALVFDRPQAQVKSPLYFFENTRSGITTVCSNENRLDSLDCNIFAEPR